MYRNYFLLLIIFFVSSCSSTNFTKTSKKNIFKHGIASGDPLSDQVIIWTRISGFKALEVSGIYQVALDKDFNNIVSTKKFKTSSKKDYTVKIDVKNLTPDTRYFYRFKVAGQFSEPGRTKTLPVNTNSIRLAFTSCATLEHDKFFLYKEIAKLKKLNAIIHLGDYIYEFPGKELITLSDYRKRYAQYRSQKNLILSHQLHPFISVWDDHEIADNSYKSGALEHDEKYGNFLLRKKAAKQAYFEWMPIRESENEEIYRSFDFGGLLRLILLDTRLAGRTVQGGKTKESTILGRRQERWFFKEVFESKATWNLIGSQVMFSNLYFQSLVNKFVLNPDSWDGYLRSKKKVTRIFDFNKIKNTHMVSGDSHASWFIKIPDLKKTKMWEVGIPAISSGNYGDMYGLDELAIRKSKLKKDNPWIEFANLKDNGFIVAKIDQNNITAVFHLYGNEKLKKSQKLSIYSQN